MARRPRRENGGLGGYCAAAKSPRSCLTNRRSTPLAAISRIAGAYRVAAGVLPLEAHSPFLTMTAMIWPIRMGRPAPVRTLAAASRPDRRGLGLPTGRFAVGPGFAARGAGG